MPKMHSGKVHNIFEKSLNVRQILPECLEVISKTFQMFSVEMRYFSKVLDQRHIRFNVFVYIYETFWSFCVQSHDVKMCCVEIQFFSDVLSQKKTLSKHVG